VQTDEGLGGTPVAFFHEVLTKAFTQWTAQRPVELDAAWV
jgi:hypothetical protein